MAENDEKVGRPRKGRRPGRKSPGAAPRRAAARAGERPTPPKSAGPRSWLLLGLAAAGLLLVAGWKLGCAGADEPAARSARPSALPGAFPEASPEAPAAEEAGLPRRPAPARLVAIGDVHGDFDATRRALALAGAIDPKRGDTWAGGELVVVQTGDQLDRGDGERAILDLFERLEDEAPEAGGAFVVLNGNHELMNAAGDFRYVTPGGFRAFADVPVPENPLFARLPDEARPRAAAFFPGGPYARQMAERDLVALVGDTLFAHAGVLDTHVRYGLGRLNREARAWLRGERASLPAAAADEHGPVWTRLYGQEPDAAACAELGRVLRAAGAKRMVVGHTVQRGGISAACKGRVHRIDVGMSRAYGGEVQVLEIRGDEVRVLSEAAPAAGAAGPRLPEKAAPAGRFE